jgi:hypothetical protein
LRSNFFILIFRIKIRIGSQQFILIFRIKIRIRDPRLDPQGLLSYFYSKNKNKKGRPLGSRVAASLRVLRVAAQEKGSSHVGATQLSLFI